MNPGYAEAWYAKEYILGEMEKRSEALDAYRKAIALNPSSGLSVRAWINTGNVLGELGKASGSAGSLRQGDRDRPQRLRGVSSSAPGPTWYNKAVTLAKLGREKEARQAYEKAVDLRSKSEKLREPVKEMTWPVVRVEERIKQA